MKNKFLLFLTVISLVASSFGGFCVSAADGDIVINIEAEDYTSGEGVFSIAENEDLSGGKYIKSWTQPTGESRIIYAYEFSAPVKGTYKMSGIFSELSKDFTTDLSFYVNDESNTPGTWTKGTQVSSVYVYNMTSSTGVKLEKGRNTLYMVVNGTDTNQSGVLVAYADCFKFTKEKDSPFRIESVTLKDHPVGVYEEGEEVCVKFDYTTAAPAAQRYNMKITDLWDREVTTGEITVRAGADSHVLYIGTFPVGWYRLRLTDVSTGMEVNDYMAFSVVVSYSKRPKIEDSAIAADSAVAYTNTLQKLPNYKEQFHDLAQLAGLKWLRTRTAGKYSSDTMKEFGYMMKERGITQLALTATGAMGDKTMTGDLIETGYKHWKEMAEWYEDTLGVLEVINEMDLKGMGAPGGAERYAALYKAAAIGISDASNSPYKSMTPTSSSDGVWTDLLYANDVLKYTDVQNFHAHQFVGTRTTLAKDKAVAYSDQSLPIFLSEAGYSQIAEDGDTLALEQMKDACTVMITRALESLSNGTTKHFWFLLSPYIENGGNYSSQHTSGMPYPMYSVLSNMTYQLGEANFAGVANLPEGMTGYMFNDGVGNDVMLCYADTQNYVTIKADKVKFSDIVGYEEVKLADENGEIRVSVGTQPVYIKFYGSAPSETYYPKTYQHELNKKVFTPNERIVIQQLWSDEITSASEAHGNGYQLKAGEEYELPVKVYNLNDEKMSGKLMISADSQIVYDEEPQVFELEPWSSQEFVYKFKVADDADGGTDGNIHFWGETDAGEEISSSVSYFRISSEGRVIADDKRVAFENGCDTSRWDLANIAGQGKVVMTNDSEGSAVFNVELPGQKWFFPFFYITDEEREAMKSAQGIVFDAKAAGHDGDPGLSMFIYMKDGRWYYNDVNTMKFEKMEDDFTCCVFPFTNFSLYSSPQGAVDIREFDVDSISHIGLGFSRSNVVIPEYKVRNFGYFYSDLPSEQLSETSAIEINGIEGGQLFADGNLGTITADLTMKDELESVKVSLNDKVIEGAVYKDGKVEFELNGLERGAYTLYVTALNKQNKFFCGKKSFKVE